MKSATLLTAHDDAMNAASRAGVTIEPLTTPDELDELRAVMEEVWGASIVPPRNLLRGLAIGGSCLLIARRRSSTVGFALGWLGWNRGVHLHSHQVGTSESERRTGVGLALKLAQRSLCLEAGIHEIRWTFDPLLYANARFNLIRLGAEVVDFIPHCYGNRVDRFNDGEITDRFEVSWRLDSRLGSVPREPQPGEEVIEIPQDYSALRANEPDRAREVRREVGARLASRFGDNHRVIGMNERGYVLARSTKQKVGA